jgi:thiol:disulfide interchange protein DsbD
MRRLGVVPIRADYTLEDPEIKADLERFKRAGVPMYVVVPANRPDEPILLNEILTQRAVIEALNRAGPSDGASVSVVAKEQ